MADSFPNGPERLEAGAATATETLEGTRRICKGLLKESMGAAAQDSDTANLDSLRELGKKIDEVNDVASFKELESAIREVANLIPRRTAAVNVASQEKMYGAIQGGTDRELAADELKKLPA